MLLHTVEGTSVDLVGGFEVLNAKLAACNWTLWRKLQVIFMGRGRSS